MKQIRDYFIKETIGKTGSATLYRAHKQGEDHTVIIKALNVRFPSGTDIARLKQEYETIRAIEAGGVVKTLDLLIEEGVFYLVLEDFKGISLKEHIKNGPLPISLFLEIVLQISQTLGALHADNIIHHDLNPFNILVDPQTGEVKITGFGISRVLARKDEDLYHPDVIEGSLLYISPEQTGRMNRFVDYRTDFYSIGVTFYELLTGSPPFYSKDPMEIMHCHIAVEPPSPHVLNADIPPMLSNITMKLMLKTPEERYQNGFGLKYDLEKCLNPYRASRHIPDFTLGEKDIPIRFIIPQELVGREREIEILLAGFEKAFQGQRELLIVKGAPGIGKSAMINEVHKPIVAKHGYFISGKYDQFTKDRPYSAMVQAFEGLMNKLLMESSERLKGWREEILEAVGNNGKLITDLIPKLELIIGPQPEVTELGPIESRNRSNMVFAKFLRPFFKKEHPITLFLDDIQWADLPSLDFIKWLITSFNVGYLYVICAFRDNEVDEHHPAALTLKEIEKRRGAIPQISLGPLTAPDVQKFILNFIPCSTEEAGLLAGIVHAKTGGNPFFIQQFMQTIYNDRLITIKASGRWLIELEKIEKMKVTDNIVELLVDKISALPDDTRGLLTICAAIGNRFDLNTLAYLKDIEVETALSMLAMAIRESFVGYDNEKGLYVFHHDRIQEAAYSLIPEGERPDLHYRIGRLTMENTPESKRQELLFYVVDHLNLGAKIVTSKQENQEVAGLNLSAGVKAKFSNAYAPAMRYLEAGLGLLTEAAWQESYDLIFSLHLEGVRVAYLMGEYEKMERFAAIALERASLLEDKVKVYIIRVTASMARQNYTEALQIADRVSALVGIHLDASKLKILMRLIKLKFKLFRMSDADILALPDIKDPLIRTGLEFFNKIGEAIYHQAQEAFVYNIFNGVEMSLKFGLVPDHCNYYVMFSSILIGGFGDMEGGYRFGRLAMKLGERENAKKHRSMFSFLYNYFIRHWKEHLKNTVDPLMKGYKVGLETGDLMYAAYNLLIYNSHLVSLGHNIQDHLKSIEPHAAAISNLNQMHVLLVLKIYWQCILNLGGRSRDPSKLSGEVMDEDLLIPQLDAEKNDAIRSTLYAVKVNLAVIHHDYHRALKALNEYEKFKHASRAARTTREAAVDGCIVKLALYPEASPKERKKYLGWVNKHLRLIKKWTRISPENNRHRYELVLAEKARVLNDHEKAKKYYDLAIQHSIENEFVNNQAFANELAGRYSLSTGQKKLSDFYLKEAHRCYEKWGAVSKLNQLRETYPDLFETGNRKGGASPDAPQGSATGSSASARLDITTIKKVHKAIAGEFHLNAVLERIMKATFENAGAQRGYLLLKEEETYYIFTRGSVNEAIIVDKIALDRSHELSLPIVNFVHRTGTSLILNNATTEGGYTDDPYIARKGVKSVCCVPITYQKETIGSLYMENNLITGAFTEERLEILDLIVSEAAIAIRNAHSIEQNRKNAVLREEMEHARRIQTKLTPKHPRIEGYDITGYMKTADDVGGDYYDVINAHGVDWLVIGDVSGHGLGAGLVMMMVQSTIQVMLETNPQISPGDLLASINGAITKNIQKLEDDKYMTISVLALRENGRIEYAGLHQDLLVYRSQTGVVESIETKGIWLGVIDDIKGLLPVQHLFLDKGDVLFLYTDGITEAVRKGAGNDPVPLSDERFGDERLASVFKALAAGRSETIRDGVRDSLDGYALTDDITMLIAKRLE